MGADIHRGKNRMNGVKPVDHGMFHDGSVPNLRMYAAPNIKNVLSLPINYQLLIRVSTNLKLNLFDCETEERVIVGRDNLARREVHFLLMEGVVGKISDEEFRKGQYDISRNVCDWTIVDIDNYLKGNPHTK